MPYKRILAHPKDSRQYRHDGGRKWCICDDCMIDLMLSSSDKGTPTSELIIGYMWRWD